MAEYDHDQLQDVAVGERLRQAREARGVSLDEVASQTRIPIRHLQHIERGEWDALPAVTYSVGFARSYANAVGMDGAAVGAEVRELLGGARARTPTSEYYEPADPSRVPPRSLALIAAAIAGLLVIAYLVWRSGVDDPETGPAAVPVAEAPEAKAPAPPAGTPAATGPVVLTATEEVWLRIGDGTQPSALFQGTLQPGQRFEVPPAAQQPLVRTGRPQVLRVSVGGRDLGQLEPVERTVTNVSLRAADLLARVQADPAAPAPRR